MGSSAPSPATVLDVFDTLGPPGTPLTTTEVAREFDCTDQTIYNKLDALVNEGVLETKKVGARGRMWWRPLSDHGRPTNVEYNLHQRTENPTYSDGSPITHQSGGEMAKRIHEFEWAKTPLGGMENWPQQLRIAVATMLNATEAIEIYWEVILRSSTTTPPGN
ncbi:hypothetical protein [Haladaptatus sp. DFWS20]|uniref:hypothetical protein n=1 Tax=Haladaptatus sp. DFWS20 TaxID=3403467 RepID=UPI003EBB1F8A